MTVELAQDEKIYVISKMVKTQLSVLFSNKISEFNIPLWFLFKPRTNFFTFYIQMSGKFATDLNTFYK